jgi:signal transduction histidine kinase
MFNNVQWRIALWFIGLSTAVYIIPTALAMVLFYMNLTATIDGELKVFMASFGHAINVVDGKPVLRDWARTVQTDPAQSLITYQLFDREGHLLEAHGQPTISSLFKEEQEVFNNGVCMRTRMTALKEGAKTIGYLQIQSPTKPRDDAVRELALVMAIFAPVVLLGLGWSSYLVSEKATVSIRQTNAMLRQFVADASHELHTPLSIVRAAHESLEREVKPLGVGVSEFEITESTLERMENMLEDLMLLSSMESPELTSSTEIVSLGGLLEDVVNEFRPKFEQRGVSLSLTIEADGKIRGEAATLHRMTANIIENGLRYTNPGGLVEIHLSKASHSMRISISDKGIGIPDESLVKIFDRFYRVDASRSRSLGGSGLGLPIALAIAQAHGGAIEVQSVLGAGSTFSITLPAVP